MRVQLLEELKALLNKALNPVVSRLDRVIAKQQKINTQFNTIKSDIEDIDRKLKYTWGIMVIMLLALLCYVIR